MANTLTKYQKGGIYPWAHSRIRPALLEITRAVGAPDVLISCYQPKGVGLHKTGEAADFQAGLRGSRNTDAYALHVRIFNYALKNWDRLRIRYMAWDGYEYGGSYGGAERKRKQKYESWHPFATDPWHKNHVHIDFLPGNIPGANPGIAIGAALPKPQVKPSKPATKPTPKPEAPLVKDEVMIIVKSSTSPRHYITNGLVKRHIKTTPELHDMYKLFGSTKVVKQETIDAIPYDDKPWFKDKTAKTNNAAGRMEKAVQEMSSLVSETASLTAEMSRDFVSEDYRTSLRKRIEQNNHALGRLEKKAKEYFDKWEDVKDEASESSEISENEAKELEVAVAEEQE